ncbi:hypothetical protein [Methylocystis sp.]|uniref:hypothetical protein n=1 Tax=Methylocystis sp. TaxID=1911079 RepID=UPI003DA37DC4
MAARRFCDSTVVMARQTVIAQKKKRGPPATGKGAQIVVRMQPDALGSLDSWIAKQPEPQPTRPEAIRRLIEKALGKAS